MNDLKKYMRDLKIVKNNLTKFYYNSCSEWLKLEIINCISAINTEISYYENLFKKQEEKNKLSQSTIYFIMEKGELKCQTIK